MDPHQAIMDARRRVHRAFKARWLSPEFTPRNSEESALVAELLRAEREFRMNVS